MFKPAANRLGPMASQGAAVALLLATALGSAAQAEPMPGSRGELNEYIQAYAKCTVRYNHHRAQELVLSNVTDDRVEHDFKDIYVSEPMAWVSGCKELLIRTGVAFRLQPGLYRAALAQELVEAEMKAAPQASFSDRSALAHWTPEDQASFDRRLASVSGESKRARITAEHDAEAAKIWLAVYGECVVRKDPVTAWSWLVAKPGSSAETDAIARLGPAFGDCLVSGKTLNFPKDVLRGSIAINYYRLAKAPVAAATGVGA